MSEPEIFSHVVITKKICFPARFPHELQSFHEICDSLVQSGKFRNFANPDRTLFTEHFREPAEISRTLETREAIEVRSLQLVDTRLSGKLRLLVTVYRAGYVVLSLVHSVVPQKQEGQPVGKNLTAEQSLSSADIVFLLEEHISDHDKSLKYELRLEGKECEMERRDLLEYLLKNLEDQGAVVERTPNTNANVIHCWSPNFSESFSELMEKHYRDLFIVFTTPESGKSTMPKKEIMKQLKPNVFWSRKDRGFFFSNNSILIISPVRQNPNRLLFAQLQWIFQLSTIQSFMLQHYSREVRRMVAGMTVAVSKEPAKLLAQIFEFTSAFSLGLEDLYWVEEDLFRMQAARFVAEYKRRFDLDKRLASLQKRFEAIEEKCIEARESLQRRAEREREKSITYLTAVFATFGLGEVLSNFVVWYFGYYSSNTPRIPNWLMIAGLLLPLFAMSLLYIASRWYIGSKYQEDETK